MRTTAIAAPLMVAAITPLLVGAAPCGTPRSSPAATPATAAPGTVHTVGVIDTDSQGRVFTDPNFLVLYHDDRDHPGGSFDCLTDCLKLYHPLLTRPGAALSEPPGVVGTLGSVNRPDGAGDQVTINGFPVYTFSGDQAGETGGLTPLWHAVPAPVRLPGLSGAD